jgi:hypothetical protein
LTKAERREHAVKVLTASILYRLLKDEGNEAAMLLFEDIQTASLKRHIRDLNEAYAQGRLVPLILFSGGVAKRAKIIGELI